MFTVSKPYICTSQTYGLRFGNNNHFRWDFQHFDNQKNVTCDM